MSTPINCRLTGRLGRTGWVGPRPGDWVELGGLVALGGPLGGGLGLVVRPGLASLSLVGRLGSVAEALISTRDRHRPGPLGSLPGLPFPGGGGAKVESRRIPSILELWEPLGFRGRAWVRTFELVSQTFGCFSGEPCKQIRQAPSCPFCRRGGPPNSGFAGISPPAAPAKCFWHTFVSMTNSADLSRDRRERVMTP